MQEIILASSNRHKLKEIQAILADFGYRLVTMKEAGLGDLEIEETGKTFEENALIKAQAIFDRTGKITLADDSGLEVDALGGEPGVYSARYAGEPSNDENNKQKLLVELDHVQDSERTARFVSVIAMLFPDGHRIVTRGEVEGIIGRKQIGTNGFGYDPLFVVPNLNKTFAELDATEKNRMSHRANALKKLKTELRTYHENCRNQ
ncbi:XTP/dITP diphosphatase [Fusibacter tunisiensis]|jgi:XTP/dITP diphosphohydrolase|uniref:dITP/XTP pyrophosphatase n=1 Tax=Fusibacter tunisiensis TaxID=1008308 RepID=A0ABS2MSE5_9FIRM|nr:XTP/dITP diphosphatase [Fusibacter tunisiensis]MBM7562321.1 XTP/dITP diphosphohydrolase [Fusibacter tunisiensis]